MPPMAPVWLEEARDHLVLGGACLVVQVEELGLAVLGHARRGWWMLVGQADRQARISAPFRPSPSPPAPGLNGAEILACLSAWPTSITNRARAMAQDRQAKLSTCTTRHAASRTRWSWPPPTRPAPWAACASSARPRSSAPGGDILAVPGPKAGLAVAEVDVAAEIDRARRVLRHLTSVAPPRTGNPL